MKLVQKAQYFAVSKQNNSFTKNQIYTSCVVPKFGLLHHFGFLSNGLNHILSCSLQSKFFDHIHYVFDSE